MKTNEGYKQKYKENKREKDTERNRKRNQPICEHFAICCHSVNLHFLLFMNGKKRSWK